MRNAYRILCGKSLAMLPVLKTLKNKGRKTELAEDFAQMQDLVRAMMSLRQMQPHSSFILRQ
jgi:hypothetical protein